MIYGTELIGIVEDETNSNLEQYQCVMEYAKMHFFVIGVQRKKKLFFKLVRKLTNNSLAKKLRVLKGSYDNYLEFGKLLDKGINGDVEKNKRLNSFILASFFEEAFINPKLLEIIEECNKKGN